ncbi:MAG: efflux RND transporter permease subunit [Pedobacter sp.]|nr:MAG: efflux RND transporter permease subunit [Pedobacter sp.]
MFKKFIDRPVLSTVISILIVILGLLGIIALPVSQYPEIAPPTISVSASYQGANADVVMSSVVIPLEEQINGVEDMTYMTSTASNDGTATITINFKLGTNPDLAAVNVQNRVARATSLLPAEVTRAGVITQKRQSSNVLIFALQSENPIYDQKFLQNYAEINLIPQIKRIAGVGDVMAFGQSTYAMRIWLKPDIMAAYQLVPSDINAMLAEQNIEAAPGQFGEQGDQSFQYTIKYSGRLKSEAEFGEMIIKTAANGQVLKLKDVARIELGALSYASTMRVNGKPGLGFAVSQTAGSNAKEVIEGALKAMEDAKLSFPKGIEYLILTNANDFLDASIEKVIHTLIEAFILVFIVVFIFLQDFRSTLIPAISVPVAIIGTFFFLNLFGFTINLLTLFALVLAIGIVVDDAIVVVEAVHAKLDKGYQSAKKATVDAMDEITGAIISITLVMSAVFIPVSFIGGSSGVFFKQFGLTLAISIVLSAINALTLSPALCALLLKPHKDHINESNKTFSKRFFTAFNTGFEKMTNRYQAVVAVLIKRKLLAIGGLLIFVLSFAYLMHTTPKGFVPNEDMGSIMSDIALPPGTSMERTQEVLTKVDSIVRQIPEIRAVLRVNGRGMISGNGSAYGMVIGRLVPWNERERDVKTIIQELFAKTANIKEARIIFFAPPTIQGFGMSGGFELQLQDKTGGTIQDFTKVSGEFISALNKRPEIQYASTSFNPNFPQYLITANVAKIKQAGLQVNDVLSVMQGYYGGVYGSNFNKYGKQYRVMYQAEPEYRANLASLNQVMVRTKDGLMAPIQSFISLERVNGPQAITRFNLYTSIAITGNPQIGFSSGDAIQAIKEEVAKLPAGYGYEFSGLSREEQSAGNQTVFIFLLCLVFVYFLLAAQYESYILPLAVILSLPVGLAGTFIFGKIFGVDNNIYTQITLIMLIGLLAKNAILVVEFALDRRRNGMPIIEAALQGASARLRPILMTSFAFILGLVPLMLSSGVGAEGNNSIGTGAIGGMLIGTVFGIFVIPVLFVIFQVLQEKVGRKPLEENTNEII